MISFFFRKLFQGVSAEKFMPNYTIEGAQLASEIAPYILKKIDSKKIPLMTSLLKTISKNKKLIINW